MDNGLSYENYTYEDALDIERSDDPVENGIMKESRRVVFTMLDNGCPPEKISYLCGYSREFVERMIRLWDPDFSKVTGKERVALNRIEEEMRSGEYIMADQIYLQLKKDYGK